MTATTQRRRLRGTRPRPPLDFPDGESKSRQGALLPQRSTDCTPHAENIACVVTFLLAIIVRLWKISYPANVVFDEVHFLRFVKNYYDGQYLFDIHPPLGKLILLGVSKIFCGNPPRHLVHNGMPFGDDIRYVPLRVTSALFGAATTPVLFLIAREMGLSLPAALLPALAHALDNLSIIESRVVVMDAQLTFFMAAALLAALRLFGCPYRDQKRRARLLLCTAVMATAAISVKWTTGVTPLLIGVVSILGNPFMRGSLRVVEMGSAGAVAVFLYLMFFWIHFWLLPYAGDGDAFMLREFQMTLKNNSMYQEGYKGPSFLRNFMWLNGEMYRANARITTRHHWESKWYQWVINQRGLLYFDEPVQDKISRIYLIVNPAVGFAALAAVIASVFILAAIYVPRRIRKRIDVYSKLHGFAARAVFLLAGYVLNLVPYLEVSRCTFLYHYIPPLFYAELLLANVVDIAPQRFRWRLCIGISTMFVIAFVYWAPWIYGSPLSENGHRMRRLYGKHWDIVKMVVKSLKELDMVALFNGTSERGIC